jgi:hypothetical protein
VRPSPPYFSPDGDLGGVNPFYVGDPGCFCIFVMKRGEGGWLLSGLCVPSFRSLMSREISWSEVLWLTHF